MSAFRTLARKDPPVLIFDHVPLFREDLSDATRQRLTSPSAAFDLHTYSAAVWIEILEPCRKHLRVAHGHLGRYCSRMSAAEVVKALGGRYGLCRCPAHDDHKPSLSVSEGPDGRLLTHCFAGCPPENVWQALKDQGLVDREPTRSRARQRPARRQPTGQRTARAGAVVTATTADRRHEAWAIWQASRPAIHTPAQAYLQARGITLEPPGCIRYHEGLNALVAVVRHPDGRFAGVQRIFLTPDGYSSKLSLGPLKGGAVRLTPPAPSIQVCESVEDGLALWQMTDRPTWACLGTSMLAAFESPDDVREVILAPDHDKAGLEAIKKASERLCVVLRQLLPPEGMDWVDLLEEFEERAGILEFGAELIRDEAEHRSWVEAFCDGV